MLKYLNKKTKIIATLGPSLCDSKTIESAIKKGVNVFRINCSHSKRDEIVEYIRIVRKASKDININVCTFVDLQGPKIRIRDIKENVLLKKGEEFILTTDDYLGDSTKVQVNYKQIIEEVKPKEKILLDDGKLVLEVIETNGKNEVLTRVIQGGELKPRKGVNLPDTDLSIPPITKKDLEDLEVAVSEGIDWIALSFVRRAEDIAELNDHIAKMTDEKIPIISKIERPEALDRIDEIIKVSNGIMVARGDLGIEIPSYKVPLVQKNIINKAVEASKPVIVATQLLESMIENVTASRSDISDISNAVLDGADALMMSAETSIGKNALSAIETMSEVIIQAEKYLNEHSKNKKLQFRSKQSERIITSTICAHSSYISRQDKNIKSINIITKSGYTASKLSSMRPLCPIMAFSPDEKIQRRLCLLWGVKTFHFDITSNVENSLKIINQFLKNKGVVKQDDMVINLMSINMQDENHMVDTLRITQIK